MNHDSSTEARLWLAAQWIGVVLTLALLAGLLRRPAVSLDILWNILIPLVPASLLITPMLWRNVCPLATLNLFGNRPGGRSLGRRWLSASGAVGILLLLVLVPARRFVFNTDGTVLAITIAAVALLALALGTFFDLKAGFCNSICPVLPVERLYGQRPLLRVGNPRCTPCSRCTESACIDVAPRRSVSQSLGAADRSAHWLRTTYGAFAAAFPGFVLGYFTLGNGPLSTAGDVYVHVALCALGSYAVTAALTLVLRLRTSVVMVLLGGGAAALYYWFAADTITTAFALPDAGTLAMRVGALALVATWGWRALREEPSLVLERG